MAKGTEVIQLGPREGKGSQNSLSNGQTNRVHIYDSTVQQVAQQANCLKAEIDCSMFTCFLHKSDL